MKSNVECYPCLLKLAIDMGRIATDDEEIHWAILQETLSRVGVAQKDRIPIAVAKEIQAIVRRLSNNPDPYATIKRGYNRKARDLIAFAEKEIARSDDGLLTALKMIAIANIIDFVALDPDRVDLVEFLRAKLSSDFKGSVAPKTFVDALHAANSLLYVADNCGEIVFDCHFINRFLADKRVYLSVRGGPVLNDVTREDLEGVSLHEGVTIVDTGDDSPGAIPETSGETFNKLYEAVDLVILKGQGNFEGIGAPGRADVYSLFIAKCPVVAGHVGCEIDDLVLTVPG